MSKYIDADKLLDIIIKMQKEYATQEVTEDHKGLRAVLGGQCLVLTEIIEIIDSLPQEQPSLPSNLDEAAEHWVDDVDNTRGCDYIGEVAAEHAFKEGAKWMAEQGYSQEEIVDDKSLEIGYGVLPGITPIINLPDSFNPGDKVIVQIRKKEE